MSLPSRAAVKAAHAVIEELEDRSGFDGWWGDLDEDIQSDILTAVAEKIDAAYRG